MDTLLRLRQMRDEIRLEVHLAGMEAKSRWEQLEPMIDRTERLAEDVSGVSRRALYEIMERVGHFRDSIRRESHPPH